jgi:hypothetical protein
VKYDDDEFTRRVNVAVNDLLENPIALNSRFRGWVPRYIEMETDLAARLTALESDTLDARITALETQNAWTAYTPALTALTTNPTLGAGSTATGRWVRQKDRTIEATAKIIFGTSGVAPGSGNYLVSLPVAAGAGVLAICKGYIFDFDTSDFRLITGFGASSTTIHLVAEGANTVSDASPWTWAASDQIQFSITYEAAS